MKILLTGGTGFIGTPLVHHLISKGHELTLLVQAEKEPEPGLTYLVSKSPSEVLPLETLATLDAIINLAGYSIGKDFRWNEAIKEKILQSRLSRTKQITASLIAAHKQGLSLPPLLINASAVGFYGTNPSGISTEETLSGNGFLANVCREWEMAAEEARTANVKVVRLRFGIVLGSGGGVLERMAQPFSFGIGGIIGNGENWVSWIHRSDLIAIIELALSGKLDGPYNATAPRPVTMEEFGERLGDALDKHAWTKMPIWLARLIFGEMAEELLLCSQKAFPNALLAQGFTFRYPTLEKALQQIYDAKPH